MEADEVSVENSRLVVSFMVSVQVLCLISKENKAGQMLRRQGASFHLPAF
jgi:hypothetical protein